MLIVVLSRDKYINKYIYANVWKSKYQFKYSFHQFSTKFSRFLYGIFCCSYFEFVYNAFGSIYTTIQFMSWRHWCVNLSNTKYNLIYILKSFWFFFNWFIIWIGTQYLRFVNWRNYMYIIFHLLPCQPFDCNYGYSFLGIFWKSTFLANVFTLYYTIFLCLNQ